MKPEFAIIEEIKRENETIIFINERKARVRGHEVWGSVFAKRKFENLLKMMRAKERLKIFYR